MEFTKKYSNMVKPLCPKIKQNMVTVYMVRNGCLNVFVSEIIEDLII